ncbi:methyltransferase domain-containing protein [Methylobacterium sp. Leaf88]|uniref:class I SAM-dependent methyltransferase n=1 Tax=Methylobacterium sp. Leaf88 TaxID=1736244 RepID=UPI001FCD8873|nr:methyltransferase domain-containing protein [Methylobacterium sp. Leaf88]
MQVSDTVQGHPIRSCQIVKLKMTENKIYTQQKIPHMADLAEQILLTFGVGRYAVFGQKSDDLIYALREFGICANKGGWPYIKGQDWFSASELFRSKGVDNCTIVCLVESNDIDTSFVHDFLSALHRSGSNVFLHTRIDSNGRDRKWWETYCFEAGFRKSPLYYIVNEYSSLEAERDFISIPLERISNEVLQKFPLAFLRTERDLHMDMLRESGSRSDAHVARYNLAAKYVRPGDRVLDAACGFGYGSYVIKSIVQDTKITAIDNSDSSIQYGQSNFSSVDVCFASGNLPECLEAFGNNSFDVIACFETLEHVQNPIALLKEFHRLLTPGGRLVVSVPNDWTDETGNDPNPYHLQVYDHRRFVSEITDLFEIEHLIGQTADRAKKAGYSNEWIPKTRAFEILDAEKIDDEAEAEWLIAVGCTSPLLQDHVAYEEKSFSREEIIAAGNSLAFARDYENPWLIKSLISIGMRTENGSLRARWATEIAANERSINPDLGSALTVLLYSKFDEVDCNFNDGFIDKVYSYISNTENSKNPTDLRWRVSLYFALGKLYLRNGLYVEAIDSFEKVIASDVASYSPTLLTKTAEAAFLHGMLCLSQGRGEEAQKIWRNGFFKIVRDFKKHLLPSDSDIPPAFYTKEIADALSIAGRMASLAVVIRDGKTSPYKFHVNRAYDNVSQIQSLNAIIDSAEMLRRSQPSVPLEDLKWLEQQRDAWKLETDEINLKYLQLEQDFKWMQKQRDDWEMATLKGNKDYASLLSDYEWMQGQRDAWEALVKSFNNGTDATDKN